MSTVEPPNPLLYLLLNEEGKYGISGRSFVQDGELANRLHAIGTPEALGANLAATLLAMPHDDQGWHQLGLPSYTHEPYKSAALLILSAVGTDERLAESFLAGLKAAPEDDLPEVPFGEVKFRQTCVLRPWNNAQHNPAAIAALAEHFLGDTDVETFRSLLNSRYSSLSRHSEPKHSTGPDAITQFDRTLAAMRERALPEGCVEIIDRARAEYKEHVEARLEQERRSSLASAAKAIGRQCKHERTLERLDEFEAAVQTVAEFDPEGADAILLDGLDAVASSDRDSFAGEADRRLNDLFERLAERNAGGAELPTQVTWKIDRILERRLRHATAIDGDRVVVDEQQLHSLNDIAQRLGAHFELTSARHQVIETIPWKQERLDAERLISVTPDNLPREVLAVSISVPTAHMRYSSVDELIGDIRSHFVLGGRSPEDVHAAVTQSTGMADHSIFDSWANQQRDVIYMSLAEELREWHASGSAEDFRHSHDDGHGSPYKYSGNAFEGNRFMARHDSDGSILFTLGSGGYGYNHRDPSENLNEFALSVGKSERVEYEAPPVIEFAVAPPASSLESWANTPLERYEQRRYERKEYSSNETTVRQSVTLGAQSTVSVDASQLVEFVGRAMGTPGLGALIKFNPQQATEINAGIRALGDQSMHANVGASANGYRVTVRINRPGRREMSPVVKADGMLVLPEYVRWNIPLSPTAHDKVELSVESQNIAVQVTTPDLTATEMVRRAKALRLVFGSLRPDNRHPDAPAWEGRYWDGSVRLSLPPERAPVTIAGQVEAIISAGPQPVSKEQRLGRDRPALPEID